MFSFQSHDINIYLDSNINNYLWRITHLGKRNNQNGRGPTIILAMFKAILNEEKYRNQGRVHAQKKHLLMK